jgi:hypothetical protein
MTLSKRQKMLLEKAIECLEDISGYDTIPYEVKGYDGQDFDPGTLADDLQIEFELNK